MDETDNAVADRVAAALNPVDSDLASFLRTGRGAPAEQAITDARTIADLRAGVDSGRAADDGTPLAPELVARVGHLLQRQLALAARLYELKRGKPAEAAPVVPLEPAA